MTPEDKQRIEAIRHVGRFGHDYLANEIRWLLELVERQEAEIARLQLGQRFYPIEPAPHMHNWTWSSGNTASTPPTHLPCSGCGELIDTRTGESVVR